MTVDVVKAWFQDLAAIADLAGYVAFGLAILFVLWLVSTISARAARRQFAAQIQDLDQRLVVIEARRERDLLRHARIPAPDTETAQPVAGRP